MGQGTPPPASLVALQTTSWADSNTPLETGWKLMGILWDFQGSHWICYGILWILWWILWSKHKCQWVSERENSQEDISNIRKLRSHVSMIDGFMKDTILQKPMLCFDFQHIFTSMDKCSHYNFRGTVSIWCTLSRYPNEICWEINACLKPLSKDSKDRIWTQEPETRSNTLIVLW